MDEDTISFQKWFSEEGFAEEHQAVFAQVWNAALESVKNELDGEHHDVIDSLKAFGANFEKARAAGLTEDDIKALGGVTK